MKTAVFTIASRNYFAFVRTLMNSLEKSNPQWERHVVVVDEIGEEFEKIPRNFELVSLDALDLPEAEKMKFRYTIMEFNTAVKPFAILKLFEEYDRVIYIDPDIYVYEKMQEVEDAMDQGYEFVLTPHFTGLWKEDGCMPDEPAIMRAGVYNLGFIAMSRSESTIEMTKWWADKLEKQCVVDIAEGIFVDQKWIDLVPGRYDKVFILRHEGYNIAYWNLSHRTPSLKDGKYYFNGQPLIFFHYSGFNPRSFNNISKHQNRFTINDMGVAKTLFEEYAKEALSNDFDMWKKFKYAYAIFSDGTPVNELFRYVYRDNEYIQEKCGDNPFVHPEVFLQEEKSFVINYMLHYIWKSRPDLQKVFSSPESEEFLGWARSSLEREYGLSAKYIAGLRLKNEVAQPTTAENDVKCINKISFKRRVKNYLWKITPAPIWEAGRKVYRTFRPKQPELEQVFIVDETQENVIEAADNADSCSQVNGPLKDGVNLIGYIKSEHGVGEACRLTAACLDTTELEWAAFDYEVGNPSRQKDTTWAGKIEENINYNMSIFNINADQMFVAKEHLPRRAWEGYKIGIWYWELMEFPDMWCDAFDLVDEIWAPTKFVQEALAKKAICPVLYMPPGLEKKNPDKKYDRNYFGLPKDAFLFLNMFDSFSFASRKNPVAAVKAFQKTFSPDDMSVGLVLKINNAELLENNVTEFDELKNGYKNIYIIAKTFSREEVDGLLNVCDVAVSLHRSEGLGLLCEEAMYYGKPVIATGWSGNMDFMSEECACIVDYDLKAIGEDVGPYKKWQKWADADVNQAASYMKKLKEDGNYYNMISAAAAEQIKTKFSPEVCGKRMQERIEEIRSWKE